MLGLSMNDVDTIRSSYRQDEHHQRLAELWHSRGNDCTWSNLLTVLDRLYPRRKSSVSVTSPLPETYGEFIIKLELLNDGQIEILSVVICMYV